jgi:hypothetical protein
MGLEIQALRREAILRVLECNRTRYGLAALVVARVLPGEGFHCAVSEVQADLDWLVDKQFVRVTHWPLAPEQSGYVITAAGRDIL